MRHKIENFVTYTSISAENNNCEEILKYAWMNDAI